MNHLHTTQRRLHSFSTVHTVTNEMQFVAKASNGDASAKYKKKEKTVGRQIFKKISHSNVKSKLSSCLANLSFNLKSNNI